MKGKKRIYKEVRDGNKEMKEVSKRVKEGKEVKEGNEEIRK